MVGLVLVRDAIVDKIPFVGTGKVNDAKFGN